MNRPKLLLRETFLEYFPFLIFKTESCDHCEYQKRAALLFYLFAPENLLFFTCAVKAAYFLLPVEHKDVVNHTALKSFL